MRCVAYQQGVARRNVAYQKRVIDFAGLAEIRPDEGIMLLRVPVNGAVMVEEARSLIDGARDERQSGYLHTDIRGSTLARADWSEQMSLPFEEAEYGAWGETLSVSGLDAPTHQFVGFEPDPATGWYFMGARVYDPELRRWLSPDPLLLAAPEMDALGGQELNLYSYARNNPVDRIDPNGTQSMPNFKYGRETSKAQTDFVLSLVSHSFDWLGNTELNRNEFGGSTPPKSWSQEALDIGIFAFGVAGAGFNSAGVFRNAGRGGGAGHEGKSGLQVIIDWTINSAKRPAKGKVGDPSRGFQGLQKKIDRGMPNFKNLEKSDDTAEEIIREIISSDNVWMPDKGKNTIHIFDKNGGRGIKCKRNGGGSLNSILFWSKRSVGLPKMGLTDTFRVA